MDWRTTPRRLSCVLLVAIAALPAAAIAPAPTVKTCEALTQWARDNRDSLPRDYRGMQAYPSAERRVIYTHLSAEEKAAFWNDKISAYLEEHPQLTAGQKQAIAEARAIVTPDLYAVAQDRGARDERLAAFLARLAPSLGEPTVSELFYGLGPAASRSGLGYPPIPLCDCFVPRDCPASATCIDMAACQPTIEGCGPIGTLECQGLCTQ